MKHILKTLGIYILFSLLFLSITELLLAQQQSESTLVPPTKTQDTTLQETYVSKVIISAPWAKKNMVYDGEESPPGQFGVSQNMVPDSLRDQADGGLLEGPTSFTIAPNGDIYITDPLNYRIERFSPGGEFLSIIRGIKGFVWNWKSICVDQDGNLYLRWDEPDKISVRKYDQAGTLITSYPIFEDGSGPAGAGLFCDKNGRLFIQSSASFFQFGTTHQLFSAEQQRASLRKGVLGGNNLGEFIIYSQNVKTREFIEFDSSGSIIKSLPSGIKGVFLGGDEKDRIYTISFTYDRNFNTTTYISKYDNRGNLISTFSWDITFGSSWASDYWWGNREVVDTEGNIYFYYSTKEGITITKWYKE